ncbi:MAG: hypothetical protein ACR2O2_03100 [Ruegeria sp.]
MDILEKDEEKGGYWARGEWQAYPYGNGANGQVGEYAVLRCANADIANDKCLVYDNNYFEMRKIVDSAGNPAPSENLTWPEVLESSTPSFIEDLLEEALGDDPAEEFIDNVMSETKGYKRKPRVMTLCDSAKDKGVVIFAIAFETDEKAKELMQYCASDAGAYYEASGEEIVDVFASIGSAIRNLRLTH